MTQAERSVPFPTQRVPIEADLELEVMDSGGKGGPVLLLHGFPDSLTMWNGVAEHLLAAGHRVIAYDQRGFGVSTAPAKLHRYALDRIVQDAVDVLSKLGVNDQVTVVGHDWGAFVSWALCLSKPELVRRHVAISTGHPAAVRTAGVGQFRKNFYAPGFMFPGLAEWALSRRDFALMRRLGATHPDVNGYIADLGRPGRLTAALNWYRKNSFVLVTRRWGRCRIPTRGFLGTDDAYFGEKQMTNSKHYMDADWDYVRIEGAGHYVPIEQPERVAELIDSWAAGD
jgi:pimeloyl-ACP methyl ester carboxylesterase